MRPPDYIKGTCLQPLAPPEDRTGIVRACERTVGRMDARAWVALDWPEGATLAAALAGPRPVRKGYCRGVRGSAEWESAVKDWNAEKRKIQWSLATLPDLPIVAGLGPRYACATSGRAFLETRNHEWRAGWSCPAGSACSPWLLGVGPCRELKNIAEAFLRVNLSLDSVTLPLPSHA
jgi:hypothetical protein